MRRSGDQVHRVTETSAGPSSFSVAPVARPPPITASWRPGGVFVWGISGWAEAWFEIMPGRLAAGAGLLAGIAGLGHVAAGADPRRRSVANAPRAEPRAKIIGTLKEQALRPGRA